MKMLHDAKALNVPMQSAVAPAAEPTVVNHGVPAAIARPAFEPDRAMDANSSMDIDTPNRLLAIDTPKPSWSEQSLSVVDPVISGQVCRRRLWETQKIVRFGSREEFLATLYPHAEKAAKTLGTQPEVLLAQSALETGWGQKLFAAITARQVITYSILKLIAVGRAIRRTSAP